MKNSVDVPTKKKKTSTKTRIPSKSNNTKSNSSNMDNKSVKQIPKGLETQQKLGVKTIAKKKGAKQVKPSKKSLEKRFWMVIGAALLIIVIASLYWVFEGYWKDSLTPAQIEKKELGDKQLQQLEDITKDNAILKDATVTTSGPIIYVTYYVAPETTYEAVHEQVQGVLNTIRESYPPYLDTYDINFNIQAKPEEPEGVNNYPYSGIWSYKMQNISWQVRGIYVPVELE